MKVKTLHTVTAIQSMNFKMSFKSTEHNIVYDADKAMFIIDGITFVPISNVREAVVEGERQITLYDGHESLTKTEVMAINKPKKNKVANVS